MACYDSAREFQQAASARQFYRRMVLLLAGWLVLAAALVLTIPTLPQVTTCGFFVA